MHVLPSSHDGSTMLEVWTIVAMAVFVTYLVSRLGHSKRLPPCKGEPRLANPPQRTSCHGQRPRTAESCSSATAAPQLGCTRATNSPVPHPSPAGSDLDLESQLAMNYEFRRSRAVEAMQLQYNDSIRSALHNPVYHR